MRCACCHRTINTRVMYSVAVISDAETLSTNLCSICWDALVPPRYRRTMRAYFDISRVQQQGQTEHVSAVRQLS